MRDETIYKIAIAAYLHDIGKFAQRAEGKNTDDNSLNGAFYPSEQFLNDNKDLYQPHFNNIYTHKHAVYTAAFIDHFEKVLPEKFNKGEWGLADSFANLAAGHHVPKTPLQWIIAITDLGAGGKTNVGYGYFRIDESKVGDSTNVSTSQSAKNTAVITSQTVTWESALLTWTPGNQTLKAAKDNNKTELKLGSDRSIVPEKYHEVLFNKRKEVTANISVEKTGNALKIVNIL